MNKYLMALKQRNSPPDMSAKGAKAPFAPFAPTADKPFLKFAHIDAVRMGHPIADKNSDKCFTPYCVPLPLDRAMAMLTEIKLLIGTLADAEGWPESKRVHVLDILTRQPVFSFADDLAYFQHRLDMVRGAKEASDAIARACGAHGEKYVEACPNSAAHDEASN